MLAALELARTGNDRKRRSLLNLTLPTVTIARGAGATSAGMKSPESMAPVDSLELCNQLQRRMDLPLSIATDAKPRSRRRARSRGLLVVLAPARERMIGFHVSSYLIP